MICKFCSALLLLTICSVGLSARPDAAPQSIYVVARRAADDKLDLAAEKKVKDELGKRKSCKLVSSAADAEIVLLVLTEYDQYGALVGSGAGAGSITGASYTYLKTALGIAVKAADWNEHKANLEHLRERAVWQGDVSSGMREASISKLVKEFEQSRQK